MPSPWLSLPLSPSLSASVAPPPVSPSLSPSPLCLPRLLRISALLLPSLSVSLSSLSPHVVVQAVVRDPSRAVRRSLSAVVSAIAGHVFTVLETTWPALNTVRRVWCVFVSLFLCFFVSLLLCFFVCVLCVWCVRACLRVLLDLIWVSLGLLVCLGCLSVGGCCGVCG